MVTIIGHWEQSYYAPMTEVPMWAFPLRDFDVTEWWMHPISGVRNPEERIVNLHERESLPAILAEVEGTRVFVEPPSEAFPQTQNPTWLSDFEHPEDAVYIFGSAHFNPVVQCFSEGDIQVALKTSNDKGVLWPSQVLVTVLHDRLVKSSWQ